MVWQPKVIYGITLGCCSNLIYLTMYMLSDRYIDPSFTCANNSPTDNHLANTQHPVLMLNMWNQWAFLAVSKHTKVFCVSANLSCLKCVITSVLTSTDYMKKVSVCCFPLNVSANLHVPQWRVLASEIWIACTSHLNWRDYLFSFTCVNKGQLANISCFKIYCFFHWPFHHKETLQTPTLTTETVMEIIMVLLHY